MSQASVAIFVKVLAGSPLGVMAAANIVDELGLGIAVILTIVGMMMHWHLPSHRMSMEERAKDGKLTSDEAHRRVANYRRMALATTLTGVVVLAVVLVEFAN